MAEKYTEANVPNVPFAEGFGTMAPLSAKEKADLKMRIAMALAMRLS